MAVPRPRLSVAMAVYVVGGLLGDLLDREIEGSGLTANEFAVLSALAAFEPITPTDLADFLGLAPTTMSAHSRRYVTRGLVRRRPNPDDRRSYLLELTAAGRRAVENARPGFRRALTAIEDNLDRPLIEVLEAMGDLEASLRAALNAAATETAATR